jgi:hypothetical protein
MAVLWINHDIQENADQSTLPPFHSVLGEMPLSTSALATQGLNYGELKHRSERALAPNPNPFPISDC